MPAADRYLVFARWIAAAVNSPAATYTVYHAGGATPVTVDQKLNGGE